MASLTPTWFTLRQPDGLSGPRGSVPRFRYPARPPHVYVIVIADHLEMQNLLSAALRQHSLLALSCVVCHTLEPLHALWTTELHTLPNSPSKRLVKSHWAAAFYRYNGGYWEARDRGNWSSIPPDVRQTMSM